MGIETALLIGSLAVGAAGIGVSASQAHQQGKAAKTAADEAAKQQDALLAEAEKRDKEEDSTATQTSARARQRALAQAAAAQGRRSTIKTSSFGAQGIPGGSIKALIGE